MMVTLVRVLALTVILMSCAAEKWQVPVNSKDPSHRKITKINSKPNCSANVCETEKCISTAARILGNLDTSTDPCDDFYQFACGGWIKEQILPPHRWELSTFFNVDKNMAAARNLLAKEPKSSDLTSVRNAKALYRSCIAYTGGAKDNKSLVKAISSRFGTWPLTAEAWDDSDFNLEEFLMKAFYLGVHPLIRLEVSVNYNYSEVRKIIYSHALRLKKPDFGLPVELFVDTEKDDLTLQIYSKKILSDAVRFGIRDYETAKRDADEIVAVEKTLAEMFHRLHNDELQSTYTLGELDENHSELFSWKSFLTTIASSPKIGITDLTTEDIVIVDDEDYLGNMTEYFSQLSSRTQANYIIWRVLNSLESALVTEDSKAESVLRNVIYGVTAQPSAEEQCVVYVSKAFKLVMHRLLYADKFPPEEMMMVSTMLRRIQKEFNGLLADHKWVDKQTARIIREKNAALATTLVHFEEASNDTFVDTYYANLTFGQNSFVQNIIVEKEENFATNFRLLRKPYQDTFEELPHEIVAQNNFAENRMEYSSVVFEPPVFTNGIPQSLNYGGMGAIIAHEIIHAFDNSGVEWSKEGIQGAWWSNETLSTFVQLQQCMIDQYSKFFYNSAGSYVDGQLTIGENIADNGGLKIAYRAYRRHVAPKRQNEQSLRGVPYTDAQLFFINFAQIWCHVENKGAAQFTIKDTHSPTEYRVKGTLQNSKHFAHVFRCTEGSKMNPKDKCEVW